MFLRFQLATQTCTISQHLTVEILGGGFGERYFHWKKNGSSGIASRTGQGLSNERTQLETRHLELAYAIKEFLESLGLHQSRWWVTRCSFEQWINSCWAWVGLYSWVAGRLIGQLVDWFIWSIA